MAETSQPGEALFVVVGWPGLMGDDGEHRRMVPWTDAPEMFVRDPVAIDLQAPANALGEIAGRRGPEGFHEDL